MTVAPSNAAFFKTLSIGDSIRVVGFSNGQPVFEPFTPAGSGISGLTAGFLPKAATATTLAANSALDDGVTTPGVVTSSKAITAPTVNAVTANVAKTRAMTVYSVAGTPLPSAVTEGIGARAFVSDATLPTFGAAYAGSGAVASPVYSDGAQWVIG